MKWSFAGLGIILLGIIGAAIMFLFINVTTGNENDYYLLKEVTEAAMIDAVDLTYYKDNGELKIIKEKFIENFTRRFVESNLFIGNEYVIDFYDVWESPPKVTVVIRSTIKEYTVYQYTSDYSMVNNLTGILEFVEHSDTSAIVKGEPYNEKKLTLDYYASPYAWIPENKTKKEFTSVQALNIPSELNTGFIDNETINVNLESIENSETLTQNDVNRSLLIREIRYNVSNTSDVINKEQPAISIGHYYTDINNDIGNFLICTIKTEKTNKSCRKKIINCLNKQNSTVIATMPKENYIFDSDSRFSIKLSDDNGNNIINCDSQFWIALSGNIESNEQKNYAMIKYNLKWTFDEYAGIDEVGS